jgi:hypothetical protein
MATFKGSQLESFTLTEEEMQRIWKLIIKDYEAAYREIDATLARTYAKVLQGVPKDKMYNELIKYDRLDKMLNEIQDEYIKWSKRAGKKSALSSTMAVTNNYYRNLYVLDWFSPNANIDLSFSFINQNLVEQSVLGTTKSWQAIQKETFSKVWGSPINYQPGAVTLSETLLSNRTKEIAQLRQTITSGLLQGKSYSSISSDVNNVIGTRSVDKGVISYSGAKYNSLRIVRTEGTRNLNAGSLANTEHARSQGVVIVRTWDATLDGKTRPEHAGLDGKPENEDGLFFIGGDSAPYPGAFSLEKNSVNCRCSINDFVDGVPPESRAGINPVTGEREIFEWKSYEQWTADNGLKSNTSGLLVPA